MPIFKLNIDNYSFPNPELADEDGLIAIGGDLSIERLLNAYANGIFPWFNPEDPILWWSPNPRFIIYPNEFKASKSLKQKIRNLNFELRFDFDFKSIIKSCAEIEREHEEGTWITSEMGKAYINLSEIGVAHSVGVYENNKLIGGLYGIQIGTVFTGESMFSRKSDTSKIALYTLCQNANKLGIKIIDTQMETPHLLSLGAKRIERKEFLNYLKESFEQTKFKKWCL
jgi:leucyl/phenylalanyl-tRNA--protein transferase